MSAWRQFLDFSRRHPHIGTDKLPRVIENMRNTIIDCGGEVHFETRMDSLIIEKERIIGIETNTGKIFKGPVILATGTRHAMFIAGCTVMECR